MWTKVQLLRLLGREHTGNFVERFCSMTESCNRIPCVCREAVQHHCNQYTKGDSAARLVSYCKIARQSRPCVPGLKQGLASSLVGCWVRRGPSHLLARCLAYACVLLDFVYNLLSDLPVFSLKTIFFTLPVTLWIELIIVPLCILGILSTSPWRHSLSDLWWLLTRLCIALDT